MTHSSSDYIAQLDWEGLHEPRTFDGPFDGGVIIPGESKIVVSRDEDYNITGTAYGYTTQKEATPEENQSMCRRQNVTIRLHYATVDIAQFLVQSITRAPPSSPGVHVGFDLVAPFATQCITIRNTNPNQTRFSLREWYINAPPHNHFLHQRVDRKKTAIYEHSRAGRIPVADRYEMLQCMHSSMTCLTIDTGAFRFLVEYALDSFAPAWSKKLMVEYRDEWGLVPDEMTRTHVAEILSYLLGRELIPVGTTSLNREGYVIDATYTSHSRPNIRHLCRQIPRYTMNLAESPAAFEQAFVKAMVAYQKKQDSLPIAECLRRYWLAVELPPGLNIVILASTLEFLAKAWFKSQESKSRGTYMTHDAFRQLIQPEIDALAQKLEVREGGKAILKRILSANNFGSNDQTEVFFAELGLPLTGDDRKVLRGRNKYVHGGRIDISDASLTWGRYAGLFSRAMLRILELQ